MPADNQWIHAPMNEQWGGLTIQPASSDALTAEIEKVQHHVEAQGTRRNSTPPVAYDEAYTQVVDDLADEQTLVQIINDLGEPVATDNAEPPKIQQRYRSHVRNRSRRERARQRHLPPPRASSLDPAVVAERKDLLEAARSLMPPEDWCSLRIAPWDTPSLRSLAATAGPRRRCVSGHHAVARHSSI